MTPDQLRDCVFSLNPLFKLQYEVAQQAHVLLYPEGMVTLNDSAVAILQQCDGHRSVNEVIDALCCQFSVTHDTITSDVIDFITAAYDKQWLIPQA